jgi:hypothetical protein
MDNRWNDGQLGSRNGLNCGPVSGMHNVWTLTHEYLRQVWNQKLKLSGCGI